MYGISFSGKIKKEKEIKVKFWRLSPTESSNIDRAKAARSTFPALPNSFFVQEI